MIVSLHCSRWVTAPQPVPQRRRVIVLGATEASVACAFHLGLWATLIEQRGPEGPWPGLFHLIGGEAQLNTRVTAINVHERRLTVSSGESFVYDKLVSSLALSSVQRLISEPTPGRLRSGEAWRYWLNARDIELLDEATQQFFGDVDDHAAGKRVADGIHVALTMKYSASPAARDDGAALFRPRLVQNGRIGH